MAVATPVLERKVNRSVYGAYDNYADYEMSADEFHNSHIKENYARLINPATKADELMGREPEREPERAEVNEIKESAPVNGYARAFAQSETSAPNPAPRYEEPYLVTNARADSDLFRADSPINRKQENAETYENPVDEEENEDLRPTSTTIQYRTVDKTENSVSSAQAEPHINIGKRERIVIGAFISMVIALFTLVIINSAIISGLNKQVNTAEQSLYEAQSQYAAVVAEVEEITSEEYIYEYAESIGMVKN